jgi:hypothetical protein
MMPTALTDDMDEIGGSFKNALVRGLATTNLGKFPSKNKPDADP